MTDGAVGFVPFVCIRIVSHRTARPTDAAPCHHPPHHSMKQVRSPCAMPALEEIYVFMRTLFKKAALSSECCIVCLIYVERCVLSSSAAPAAAPCCCPLLLPPAAAPCCCPLLLPPAAAAAARLFPHLRTHTLTHTIQKMTGGRLTHTQTHLHDPKNDGGQADGARACPPGGHHLAARRPLRPPPRVQGRGGFTY